MDIEDITIKQARALVELLGGSKPAPSPFVIGRNYFIRTVTQHIVGAVVNEAGGFLTLRKASWVADQRGRKILKLNPVLEWTGQDVERYTREHRLPYNKLYDFVSPYGERFTIIGCTCCHIPIREGLDPRAGKFPWEQSQKECGLHQDGGGI